MYEKLVINSSPRSRNPPQESPTTTSISVEGKKTLKHSDKNILKQRWKWQQADWYRRPDMTAQTQEGQIVVFLNYSLSFIKQLIQSSVGTLTLVKLILWYLWINFNWFVGQSDYSFKNQNCNCGSRFTASP